MPPRNLEQARWFAEEVQPHEPALRAFLRGRFPALSDVDDVVQESYVRLFRARESGAVGNIKSYLFTTARNAALDLFRRRRVVPMEPLATVESSLVVEEGPGVAETLSRSQEFEILKRAIEALPARCCQVMTLQKLHGLSNREIAERLGISLHTVNAQMVIGLMRCREYLKARGVLRGKQP